MGGIDHIEYLEHRARMRNAAPDKVGTFRLESDVYGDPSIMMIPSGTNFKFVHDPKRPAMRLITDSMEIVLEGYFIRADDDVGLEQDENYYASRHFIGGRPMEERPKRLSRDANTLFGGMSGEGFTVERDLVISHEALERLHFYVKIKKGAVLTAEVNTQWRDETILHIDGMKVFVDRAFNTQLARNATVVNTQQADTGAAAKAVVEGAAEPRDG